MDARTRDSCTEYFEKLNILPLQSPYILLLALFVINNENQFAANSEIQGTNTRKKSKVHLPYLF